VPKTNRIVGALTTVCAPEHQGIAGPLRPWEGEIKIKIRIKIKNSRFMERIKIKSKIGLSPSEGERGKSRHLGAL
jgi:hypothetical protein